MTDVTASALADALRGRYHLERELGRGGMATVYLARDLRHGRDVALKVLRPDLAAVLGRERFLAEIRLTARLDHPHILTLIDSGESNGLLWYVVPFVRGESLRQKLQREKQLPLEEALVITKQIAGALEYAHQQGVVHRDLKPENILLHEGEAMLADFGIALALEEAGGNRLTETGLSLGTPQYMSPEQAVADPHLDGRSDQYSLACVAYEMLVGEPPYTGPTAQAIISKRFSAPIPSIRHVREDVPEAVDAVVRKALARAPADRYVTVRELSAALQRATLTREQSRRPAGVLVGSIIVALLALAGYAAWHAERWHLTTHNDGASPRLAVLPFENLAGEERQHFVDGVTDELTTRLSRLSGLTVIARSSAAQYRPMAHTLRQVGDELAVQYVLEGSVRWEDTPDGGSRIRISPQLIRVADASHVWAEPYEARLSSVFEVQAEIAERVAAALDLTLVAPERARLRERPTTNLEAYDYFLRGNSYLFRTYDEPDTRRAAEMYERAVTLDSSFALAWARLSQAWSLYYWNVSSSSAHLDRAQAGVDRALALAPGSAEAKLAQGLIYYRGSRRYLEALEQFGQGLQREPNNPALIAARGWVERRLGRFEESSASLRRALSLDPRTTTLLLDLGYNQLMVRRYDEADRLFGKVLALVPDNVEAHTARMVVALAATGRGDEARRRAREATSRLGVERLAQGFLEAGGFSCILLCRFFDSTMNVAFAAPRVHAGLTLWGYYVFRGEALTRLAPESPGAARELFDSARVILETGELSPREPLAAASAHVWLGRAYLGLGKREPAIREARAALEGLSKVEDWYSRPVAATYAALVLAESGAADQSIDELTRLLKIPSPVSGCLLRTEPWFSALHASPRFQRLLATNTCIEVPGPAT